MFSGAKKKVNRANCHVADLERQFTDFVATKPHRFSVQTDLETKMLSIRVRFIKELPDTFSLIIGDAIHNLRAALDHLMWELVGIDHGTQDRYLSFPTHRDGIGFKAACNGIKTPSQWVKDAVAATEAFDGGAGHDLFQINEFDIADKHKMLIPILRATTHPPFSIIRPDGIVMRRISGSVVLAGTDNFANVAQALPGFSIELDDNVECAPSIFITEASGMLGLPVVPTLHRLAHVVVETIDKIEAAVPF